MGQRTESAKLVNSFGEVFEANLGDVEDDDCRGSPGRTAAAHVLASSAASTRARAARRAHRDAGAVEPRSWRATLDNRAVLELGRGSDDDVVARSARFAATLGKVTDRYQRPLEYADLRHHDGYAVRLKGVSTPSAVTTDKKK